MISLESEVLQRHLPFFNGKSILLAGGINDDFPQILQKHCQSVQIWSWYFDYAKTQSAVNFEVEFQPQADLIIYYWTKNKQEVNFQLMQLLAKSKIGQEVLIIGENRCGVRSAEKLLEPYGEIGKIDSARRCGLYHFSLQKQPHFKHYFKRSAIALINSSLFTAFTFSRVVISAKSFVIVPLSIVSNVAFSSLSANVINSLLPSNSPRFLNAPVHAKIVATEFVDVSSPFRCL